MINLVIDILKANTTLTNLVDANNIYPLIQLQGGTIPSVVVQLTNTDPNDTQDKVSTYDNNSVEITSMAISPAAAWAISEAVRAALDGYTGGSLAQIRFQTQATDIFESTEVFSVTQGYSVHLKRDATTLPVAIAGLGEFRLPDLADVDDELGDAIDRQALVYDEATSEWIADGVGQVVIPVRNSYKSTALTVGQVVKAVGAQGDRIQVALFNPATDDTKLLVGVISEEIAGGADGHAQVYGELRDISTNTFEVGDVLYPQSDGSLNTTENDYPIGFVTRKQENTGRLFIRLWAPGRGYHQRYRTQASAKMFVGVGATVELYYTATADGDGFVTQDLTAAVGDGNVEERVLRYKSGAFGDTTVLDYTDAGIATDATYAEMLTAFNNLLATESAPITIYATRTEVSGRTGLLADYPGAAAAYSLRLLDTDYAGSAIRVRRASDNAEQDIGFDGNGDLDTTALATFCSGTDGFVKTWYDQSGNSNDATQTTTTNQPKIYDSATGVVTENGMPALDFDGTDDGLNCSTDLRAATGASTVVMIQNIPQNTGHQSSFAFYKVQRQFIALTGNNQYENFSISTNETANEYIKFTGADLSGQALLFATWDGSSQRILTDDTVLYLDGLLETPTVGASSFGTTASGTNSIGYRHDTSSQYCDGTIQEVIVYLTDQSSNRTGIESNINDYYSIYP